MSNLTFAGKVLVVLLRVSGVMMLTALGAVIMPFDWMAAIHRQAGLGELPKVPIVHYLTRSESALYALHGAVYLFLSFDLSRYLPVIRFLGWAGVVFGPVMLGIDLTAGMPRQWTFSEGPYVTLVSLLVLWLVRQVERAAAAGDRSQPASSAPAI